VFPIEVGRLEAVRREHDLLAAARTRFLLRSLEQLTADARATVHRIHPQESHFGDTTPGVTTQARIDSTCIITQQDYEQSCIVDAGPREVELVYLFFEELEIRGGGFVANRDRRYVLHKSPPTQTRARNATHQVGR